MIRQYIDFYNIQPDDQYVVRVTPSCGYLSLLGDLSPSSRRGIVARRSDQPSNSTVGNELVLSNSYSNWFQNPTAANGTGYVLSPIGYVGGGFFSIQVQLTGSAAEIYVIDGDGVEYSR
jgi:hypothetical protein